MTGKGGGAVLVTKMNYKLNQLYILCFRDS